VARLHLSKEQKRAAVRDIRAAAARGKLMCLFGGTLLAVPLQGARMIVVPPAFLKG
jgi:hypothetical protein